MSVICRWLISFVTATHLCAGLRSLDAPVAHGFTRKYFNQFFDKPRSLPVTDYSVQRRFIPSTRLFVEQSVQHNDERNTTSKLLKEADIFRQRARKLMEEARIAEAELAKSRLMLRKKTTADSDFLIESLFSVSSKSANRTESVNEIAEIFRKGRWSPEQVIKVLDRLHEQQSKTKGQPSLPAASFQIADTRNAAAVSNETEWERADIMIDCLIAAASAVDEGYNVPGEINPEKNKNMRWSGRVGSSLKSRRKELLRIEEEKAKRRVLTGVKYPVSSDSNGTVQEYMRRTLGFSSDEKVIKNDFNESRFMERFVLVPLWVPSSLLPSIVLSNDKIEREDIGVMKDQVLTGTRFFCTSSDSIPCAAIFRGNIRSQLGAVGKSEDFNHTAVVFEEIQKRLEKAGLSKRMQLFFLEDPEWRPSRDGREATPNPVVLAIPKSVKPAESVPKNTRTTLLLKKLSIALTLLTTLSFTVSCYSLNPNFFESVITLKSLSVLAGCLPLVIGVFMVQLMHEAAHYLVARQKGIRIGLPTPLPSLQLGSFGSITPLLSFPSNRAALLDFALSGPLTSMIVSMILLVAGVNITVHATEPALSQFPVVPVGLFKSSFLTSSVLMILAPKTMMLPLSQPIPIHPMVMVGFSGLLSSALNLLPMFRLDGGRAVSAIFGPRIMGVASASTLLFMLSLTISGGSGIAFLWGIIVLLLQRQTEIPVRDEVTQVNDIKLWTWIVSFSVAVLALTPFPGGSSFL